MKRIYLLISLSFLIFQLKAQLVSSDYLDGVVYVKVYDTSAVQISYSNPSLAISQIISDFAITNIHKPFKVPDLSVQKVYKVNFSHPYAVDSLINAFVALPYIEYAEKAPLIQLNYQPNDYNSTVQWMFD
jgi:hypothetical protein